MILTMEEMVNKWEVSDKIAISLNEKEFDEYLVLVSKPKELMSPEDERINEEVRMGKRPVFFRGVKVEKTFSNEG